MSEKKKIKRNLVEELPYWGIEDGVVILMDGRAEIGIELDPQSVTFMNFSDLKNTWSRVRMALRLGVPQRQRARFIVESIPESRDMLDSYLNAKSSTHPLIQEMIEIKAKELNDKRLNQLMMRQRYYLTCTVPATRSGKAQSMNEAELEDLLSRARTVRSGLLSRLEQAGLRPRKMDTQDAYALLWRYFNPGMAGTQAPEFIPESRRTYVPEQALKKNPDIDLPTTRRQIVGSTIRSHRSEFIHIGDRAARVITLSKLPDTSSINSIDQMIRTLAGFQNYVVIDYDHEPYAQSLRKITMKLRSTESSTESQDYGRLDHSSYVLQAAQQRLVSRLHDTGEHIYNTSCTILVMGNPDIPEEMELAKEQAQAAISVLGNTMPVVGGLQNLSIYMNEIAPFSGVMSKHAFKAIETTCADFFPLTAPWRGSPNPTSVFRNQLGGLTGIDFFDVTAQSWNGMIAGGMGSGKTFLAQSIICDMIAEGVRVTIVDRGLGYSALMEAGQGTVILMQPGQNIVINPFELFVGNEPDDEEFNGIRLILTSMVELSDDKSERDLEMSLVTAAMQKTLLMGRRTLPSGEVTHDIMQMRDFERALSTLDSINGTAITGETREIAEKLAARYKRWTDRSPEGRLVDGRTNVRLDNMLTLFDTTGLDSNPEIARVCLMLLTSLITISSRRTGERKALFVDEAWAMFKHPTAQAMIFDISRRARRYGMAFYGISQSVGDFMTIPGMVDQMNYFFIGKDAGSAEMIANIPGMTEIGVLQQQAIGMKKGQYAEFLALMRRQSWIEGEIIRVEASGLQYWTFTTVREEMKRRMDLAEANDISQAEAARILYRRMSGR